MALEPNVPLYSCLLLILMSSLASLAVSYDIATNVFVNEFRYGKDAFVEIAITGVESGWYEVILYRGEDGLVYSRHELSVGIRHDEEQISFSLLDGITMLGDSGPSGLALVDTEQGIVLQFLSYDGSFVAEDGPARGLTSTNVEVDEWQWGGSVQLGGSGCLSSDYIWVDGAVPSPGRINSHQSFRSCHI